MWPIHRKRWCRRDLHLWQVPKGFSLQRHRGLYATVTVPAGRLHPVLPLALARNIWCGKRMAMNTGQAAPCCSPSYPCSEKQDVLPPWTSTGGQLQTKNSLLLPAGRKDRDETLLYILLNSTEDTIRGRTSILLGTGVFGVKWYLCIWSEQNRNYFGIKCEEYAASVNSSVKKLTSNKTKKPLIMHTDN